MPQSRIHQNKGKIRPKSSLKTGTIKSQWPSLPLTQITGGHDTPVPLFLHPDCYPKNDQPPPPLMSRPPQTSNESQVPASWHIPRNIPGKLKYRTYSLFSVTDHDIIAGPGWRRSWTGYFGPQLQVSTGRVKYREIFGKKVSCRFKWR